MKTTPRFVHLSVALTIVTAAPSANAYLDPGTGSFVLQMIIAGALGAMFYIKTAWASIKAYLSGVFGKGENLSTAGNEETSAPLERSEAMRSEVKQGEAEASTEASPVARPE